MQYKLHIFPQDITIACPENTILLNALRDAGIAVDSPCGGNHVCGKCMVTVDGTQQLACTTRVERDMTVIVPEKKEKTIVLSEGIDSDVTIDPVKEGYLLAVDIGTTTVVCYLLDPQTGKELSHTSCLNPQQPYGADVISRIRAALDGEMEKITVLIRDALSSLIASFDCFHIRQHPDLHRILDRKILAKSSCHYDLSQFFRVGSGFFAHILDHCRGRGL